MSGRRNQYSIDAKGIDLRYACASRRVGYRILKRINPAYTVRLPSAVAHPHELLAARGRRLASQPLAACLWAIPHVRFRRARIGSMARPRIERFPWPVRDAIITPPISAVTTPASR